MSDSQDTFIFNGQRLAYNRLKHNNHPPSERAVEIPIACNFIAGLKDKSRLLEVGNVLQYYPELIPTDIAEIQARRIIDKYETAVGVDKIDLMDVDPEEKYSGIICISTVEHIGQGSDPSEAYGEEQEKYDWQGPLKAIAKVYDLLSDNGRALITVPFGRFLERGWYIQFSQEYLHLLFERYNIPKNAVSTSYLKLVNVDQSQPQPSVWVQANPEELVSAQYHLPFKFANAIAVLDITKIPATRSALTQPPTADKQPPVISRVTSKLCVNRDFQTDYYEHWIDKLQAPTMINRKYWEWVVMSQALNERGFLKAGKKGMGFAVGNEPLPSAFASLGCEIVATDQSYDIPEAKEDWATSDQLCRGKQALNEKEICPPETFDKLVSFREVDMNNIPEDLKQGEFDFIWSSCAFEHIGSLEHGLRFVKESLKCLKPGGMAIHTTEFNCSSNAGTLNAHNLVFFRHRDIERLIGELAAEGYRVEPPDYWMGDSKYDLTPMRQPHNHLAPHLKIELGGYVATSLLLIIHKPNASAVLDITKIPATRSALTQPPTADKQPPVISRVTSKLCVNRDFQTDYYEHWIDKLQASRTIHRKYWEWVVLSQALNERGFLKAGKKGMGFAVGNEPLPSAFASLGCEIVATDQNYDIPEAKENWATTDQLCRGKQALNEKQICPPETFDKLVSFREVDMNNIPEDLKQGEFDFIWSSCAFEHIGSIEHGLRFVKESLKCLKPGGMAIHTTEFNCSSNEGTLNTDNLVFFRHRDIQRLISELTAEGYRVEPPDYWMGDSKYDLTPLKDLSTPWVPHLKIELGGYVATSLLLIIHKPQEIYAESYPPVYAYGEKQQELIKIFYDISVLGYGHYESRSRTGVARVIENIASGLIASKQFDLSFGATHSWYAVKTCLDYLQTQPSFRGIPLAHSSFFKNFESKLMELYKMLENREKIFPEQSQEPQSKLLTDQLKKYLSNSIGISKQRSHLIDQQSLSEADIFHATFYHIPHQARECKKLKKFATVYDLIPIILSQFFLGKNDADYQRMQASLNSLSAEDYILCISQATKNDLLNHVKLNPERVFVTHLAANTALFYRCNDAVNIASVKHKYGIPDAPYILGVSTLEPRKNLEHVIRCFAKVVQQQGIKDLNLVLVGAKGWEYEKIFQEIANFGLSKDRIIITGYVADEDLAAIYSGAMVFIYPSLYEGFGLPPLEAMQCGIPVITSNNSSLPEVVGDAGIMLDAADADGLCHSILTLYRTPALRQEMSLKSLAQAKKFSWERCTQETIAAYKTALSG